MYCVLRETSVGDVCSSGPFTTKQEAEDYIAAVLPVTANVEIIRCECSAGGAGLYGAGSHPAGDQYGPADMSMYDRHRSDEY